MLPISIKSELNYQRKALPEARFMNQQQRLLTAPIGATLARMAAPNIFAMFIMLATSIAEAWYVGQLGTAALAGLALGFPMLMLTVMLSAVQSAGSSLSAWVPATATAPRPSRYMPWCWQLGSPPSSP
jgi:hypothetical protein